MSAVVFGAVVVIVLAAFAGGYVWGWFNGSASTQHPDGPETCRAKLRAAERTAATYKARVWQLEGQMQQLEHSMTVTGEWLLDELEQATAAAAGTGQ